MVKKWNTKWYFFVSNPRSGKNYFLNIISKYIKLYQIKKKIFKPFLPENPNLNDLYTQNAKNFISTSIDYRGADSLNLKNFFDV